MQKINDVYEKIFSSLPEKVLQIGEGNFLRAFADFITETANRQNVFNGSVVLCQPIKNGLCDLINSQNGMYTIIMRGRENGEVVENAERITSVSRCINPYENYDELIKIARSEDLKVVISNTTEAGIAYNENDRLSDTPPSSFPAKVAVILYERFKAFNGDPTKGILFLPVELIEQNGDNLKRIVIDYATEWQLGDDFVAWLNTACCFANTLVDRIVTGFPRDEYDSITASLGYEDNLLDTCEPFLFWAIECDKKWADVFPADKIGFNIVFSEDISPYRMRKVRILNGAHTLSVLAAYHCGYDTVYEMMQDDVLRKYIKKAVFKEIIPTVPLPEKELTDFANAVLERFDNPFIKHKLLDISLNSVSKYKARCLGSFLSYYESNGEIPPILTFALAALINFYNGQKEDGGFFGTRGDEKYQIKDDAYVLDFFAKSSVDDILANEKFWGIDLNKIPNMTDTVKAYLASIKNIGVYETIKKLIGE